MELKSYLEQKYKSITEAYDAGKDIGYGYGHGDGYAEGIRAAGIAPIQWRDARVCPFKPVAGVQYIVLTEIIDPADGEVKVNPSPKIFCILWVDPDVSVASIRYWCPIQIPEDDARKEASYVQPEQQPEPEEPAPMTRADILAEASMMVCGRREQDYGTPEDNFHAIAKAWEWYFAARGREVPAIDARDVAHMMCLFKMARIATGTGTLDSYVDLAGYTACAGEIRAKEIREESDEK